MPPLSPAGKTGGGEPDKISAGAPLEEGNQTENRINLLRGDEGTAEERRPEQISANQRCIEGVAGAAGQEMMCLSGWTGAD